MQLEIVRLDRERAVDRNLNTSAAAAWAEAERKARRFFPPAF